MNFIHTADWQLGKTYGGIEDPQKRALAQQERIQAIRRIGGVARAQKSEFILVAGDLFDSPTASKATVSAACSEIGQLKLPVLVIPGNHDHGGPGGLWEQAFFQREQASLAPNLRVLLERRPVELDGAWIFPCPLLRRAESSDATAWLRSPEVLASVSSGKPRVVLAHGSTQQFTSQSDDEEAGAGASNQIDLSRLPAGEFDYIALGDWHGAKQISDKAWYSGTPETDRFPKGGDYSPGNVLVVTAERGQSPSVTPVSTGRFGWQELTFDFAEDSSLVIFRERLGERVGLRANEDFLRLELTGALGVQASAELENILDSLAARLLRLKLANRVIVAPTQDEISALTERPADPLTKRVASQLITRAGSGDATADAARIALRELYAACNQP
ncbi:MAG: DNA repair exonuclease [Verrucomicrobiae bacterium]|nr:DNA repair exonuclease [Verrucomicrobiae bacterium]